MYRKTRLGSSRCTVGCLLPCAGVIAAAGTAHATRVALDAGAVVNSGAFDGSGVAGSNVLTSAGGSDSLTTSFNR